MTPQQLMDLPYAGMAEKELRRTGRWKKTPHEAIEDALGYLETALDQAQEAQYDIEHQWRMMDENQN